MDLSFAEVFTCKQTCFFLLPNFCICFFLERSSIQRNPFCCLCSQWSEAMSSRQYSSIKAVDKTKTTDTYSSTFTHRQKQRHSYIKAERSYGNAHTQIHWCTFIGSRHTLRRDRHTKTQQVYGKTLARCGRSVVTFGKEASQHKAKQVLSSCLFDLQTDKEAK